jgi:CRISPR-associated endoribonuclease Cas6
MRIKVEFETKTEFLPLEYRRKFVSYLKSSFKEYNEDLYIELYEKGHTQKSFCFSIYFLSEVDISNEGITLNSKRFIVWFTTREVLMGIHLINTFMVRNNKWRPLADCENSLKVTSITKVPEYPIKANEISYKILSPIVIRDHDERNGRDWYLTYEDEQFDAVWKRNLKSELKNTLGRDVSQDVDALKLKPIQLRKAVVLNYGIYIPCTLGSFVLNGEEYLLEYLYQAGLGSKRALGFGCLDVM